MMTNQHLHELDEFDWGDELDVEVPDFKPMTQGEIEFWFEPLYPDGTPIPVHRFRKPN